MNYLVSGASLGALAIATATPAMAQDAAPAAQERQGGVDVIIVTAQKRSEDLQDVPVSVSAIGEDALEELAIDTFDDYAFLAFAAEHKEIYRIIDEAEFVDPESYRTHYETIGSRIEERLQRGGESGEFIRGLGAPEAWALMGMNVFLGLRYVIWAREGDPDSDEIAKRANALLASGIAS